jgi:hypothetical protein
MKATESAASWSVVRSFGELTVQKISDSGSRFDRVVRAIVYSVAIWYGWSASQAGLSFADIAVLAEGHRAEARLKALSRGDGA